MKAACYSDDLDACGTETEAELAGVGLGIGGVSVTNKHTCCDTDYCNGRSSIRFLGGRVIFL